MCCSKGFVKRVIPFFATFAVGLFIASFFVSVAAPSFHFGHRFNHRDYDRQMQADNQRLREENFRLRQQQQNAVQDDAETSDDINQLVPPPPPMPPVAPRSVR